jgi:hypothetical protein
MPADDRMAFVLQLMMVLGITLVAMAICATVVVSMAFRKADLEGAKTLTQLCERAGLIQMLTVVVIALSVLILRIMELLGADATVSILSGIAGYVLGGFARTSEKAEPGRGTPGASN